MLPSSAPRRPFLLACAALAASVAAGVATTAQSSTDTWWTGFGSGADHSRYVPSKQITRGNVRRLQAAWTYPFGDTGSGPIVVRGVIYGRGRNGSLIALDAATGAERWVRERMIGMTSRGMNYWASADGRDQRLIFAMGGLLQEVDANTGKSVMSFGTNGAVDLRVGLDGRDPESIGNIQSSIPGEIFGNLVIVGSATGEGYMSPPGDIRAYDVVTGRLVWTFHTVPRPGEFGYDTWPKEAWKYVGGVNNWAEMTVDTRRGIVYVPLGSPTYDFYGADRAGSNARISRPMRRPGSPRDCVPRRTLACSRRSTTTTRCTFRRATAGCCSAAWRRSPPPAPSTSSATTTRASCTCCDRARGLDAARRRSRRGQPCISRTARAAMGADRLGSDSMPALVFATADPANDIAAGASRFDAAAIRTVIAAGKGRMPSFPHVAVADVDALVALLTAPPGGPDPVADGQGRGGVSRGSGAPPRLIVGAGSAWARPEKPAAAGRGALPAYPDSVPQYERPVINEYNTVGNRIAPPFTSIVKYDLNVPAIKWRVGFGDDPELAARGITGTGAPGMLNGVIVTASGVLFGAGRDNTIRAWDTDSGAQLWSSRFGGDFVGSPVMYETAGRQYLLVPAASTPPRGPGAGTTGPLGWVAFALPAKE